MAIALFKTPNLTRESEMYITKFSDIKTSRDFVSGKWVAIHIPTGSTSTAYDYELTTWELMLSQTIPLHYGSPVDDAPEIPYGYKDRFDDVTTAEFREAVKNVLVDTSLMQVKRLHWFPTPDACTACHDGYLSYGQTEEEAARKLSIDRGYLVHLKREQGV